ncbi:hypothetical protein [Mitsuaria sp. GD03876]|uniref:hypothetical protein n=1 Tax=Mitsuaria sp. GD03876 TaxID=2975399 RepID=UPI002448B4D9|nr:hypothetical protein [Mitsuaria sp. GD03876]MDH0863040.1 hypothetical protein [Mitsuaria sp. GD03876]
MFLSAVLRSLPIPWPWQQARARVMRPPSPSTYEHALAPGQSLMLKLARGTVMHVHAGVVDVEDAPSLWADQCWPRARRFRAGEVWVVPRTGWWRLDGRVSRDPAARVSARPPAARRSRQRPPY